MLLLSSPRALCGLWRELILCKVARFAYAMTEKSVHGLEEMQVRVLDAQMTGSKLNSQAHIKVLPLCVFPAEHNSMKKSIVD